ncbi:MAG: hypothetical protein PHO15_10915 [Eubacteriales bacterium]|nr:hypothetical protein [Eubacteriales bacterium]
MLRFPYNSRPAPRHMPHSQRQTPQQTEKKLSYDDLMKRATFSPELSFLLAMTLKDGLCQNTVLDMLKNIEPYVSPADKEAIRSILGAKQMTDDFRQSAPVYAPQHGSSGLSDYSRLTRQQALLNVLQKYASHDTGVLMHNLQRSAEMQENFERMNKRMQKLRNMGNASPEDMFEALSMFMPPEEQTKFRNMQNMMRMMRSMKDFKPEDMFKFMNNSK